MISVIAGVILAGFVAFGITEFKEPSPSVAGFMYDVGIVEDTPSRSISHDKLAEKLSKYGNVEVVEGNYIIPQAHTIYENTYGPWCSPQMITREEPFGWDCQDYSNSAAESMGGYAVGVAWNDDHMVNVGLVEDYDGNVFVFFYEPQGCFWTGSLDGPVNIRIGTSYERVP